MSDVLRNHYHTKNFDFFNAFDWLVVFATICGILALILVLIVQYNVKTLFVLLAATKTSHAIEHGIRRNLVFRTSTVIPEEVTMDFLYYHEILRKIFPVELILLLSFLVSVLAFFGYLLYIYCKSIPARTTLMLEIGSAKEKFTKIIGTLPLSAGFYEIQVNRQATKIRLHKGFLSVQLHWAGLEIKDNTLNRPAGLPSCIKPFP